MSATRWVSLPWYDGPQTAAALDAFWTALRGNLTSSGHLSPRLERQMPVRRQWQHPDLLLSQCCGLDLFTPASANLRCLATPQFSNLDCKPGSYFSYVVTSKTSTQQGRLAVNSLSSRSGCTSLLRWFADQGRHAGEIDVTGSHQASLERVRAGQADIAAIDAHSWAQLDTEGVEVIGETEVAPAPPFVAGADVDLDEVFSALELTVAQHGLSIGLAGVRRSERTDYSSLYSEALATQRPEVLARLDPRLSRL